MVKDNWIRDAVTISGAIILGKVIYDALKYRCPRCNHPVDKNELYCPNCFQPLNWREK